MSLLPDIGLITDRFVLLELCFILNKRNELNSVRSKSRYKVNYYSNAVIVTKNYIGWTKGGKTIHTSPPAHKPKKWLEMGLHKLRSLVLQNEYKYAKAKYDTMRHTIKYRTKVRSLMKKLNAGGLGMDNGYVSSIRTKAPWEYIVSNREDMADMAKEYEAHLAVAKMLKD